MFSNCVIQRGWQKYMKSVHNVPHECFLQFLKPIIIPKYSVKLTLTFQWRDKVIEVMNFKAEKIGKLLWHYVEKYTSNVKKSHFVIQFSILV